MQLKYHNWSSLRTQIVVIPHVNVTFQSLVTKQVTALIKRLATPDVRASPELRL